MNREALILSLKNYSTPFSEERKFMLPFLELIAHPDAYQRTHLPGHITGSAWILNADKTNALLVHHAKLNKWVQPGGHADGDENIQAVAYREAQEETGLQSFFVTETLFDIDIHTIPQRKDFPAHQHYDIRFLFIAKEDAPIIVSDESHDVKWISLDQLGDFTHERSVLRMKEKLQRTL